MTINNMSSEKLRIEQKIRLFNNRPEIAEVSVNKEPLQTSKQTPVNQIKSNEIQISTSPTSQQTPSPTGYIEINFEIPTNKEIISVPLPDTKQSKSIIQDLSEIQTIPPENKTPQLIQTIINEPLLIKPYVHSKYLFKKY